MVGAIGSGAVRQEGTGVSFGPTAGAGAIGTSTFVSFTDRHGSVFAGMTAEDCTTSGDCTTGDDTGVSVAAGGSGVTTAARWTLIGRGGRVGGTLAAFGGGIRAGGSSARQVVIIFSPGGDVTTAGIGLATGFGSVRGGTATGGWSGGSVGAGFGSTGGGTGVGFDSTGGGSGCVEPTFDNFANTLPGMRNVCPVAVSFTSAIDAGSVGLAG